MGLSRTSHPEIDRGFRVLTRLLRGAGAFSGLAKGIDLKNGVMVTRSQVRLAALNSWSSGSTPVIAIGQSSALQSLARNPPEQDKMFAVQRLGVKRLEASRLIAHPQSGSGGSLMKALDRRKFLRTAGMAMAAASSAGAAEGKIRAAILGTQHSHTRGKLKAMLDSPDYEVVSVCENDPAVRKQGQSEASYQGLKWVSEEELLADSSIQMVVVECRPWEAVPWGKKVIAAGKHLHLEKPAGHEWAPFKELVEEARRKKLLVQKGWVLRGHEGIAAAIKAANQGWLGDVYLLRATINSDWGPEQRALKARYPGGSMFELGGHMIDRVVEVFGRPNKVHTWLRHDASINDKLADNTLALFEYDRALAVVSTAARMFGSGRHRSFELIGSDGSFLIQPLDGNAKVTVGMRQPNGPYKQGWQEIALGPQPRYIADFVELARAIKSGTPLKLSYDHELWVHETLLRASGEMR